MCPLFIEVNCIGLWEWMTFCLYLPPLHTVTLFLLFCRTQGTGCVPSHPPGFGCSSSPACVMKGACFLDVWERGAFPWETQAEQVTACQLELHLNTQIKQRPGYCLHSANYSGSHHISLSIVLSPPTCIRVNHIHREHLMNKCCALIFVFSDS